MAAPDPSSRAVAGGEGRGERAAVTVPPRTILFFYDINR